METIRGRAFCFGDDLNTDVIHPPQFFSLDPVQVKRGLFHGLDPTLQPRLRPGDVLVGGRNFGCGSSRETSMRSLKLNGIGAIVAVDFARIFFRNATNLGVPCFRFAAAADRELVGEADELEIDPDAALLSVAGGAPIALEPVAGFIQRIWRAGGLLGLLKEERA